MPQERVQPNVHTNTTTLRYSTQYLSDHEQVVSITSPGSPPAKNRLFSWQNITKAFAALTLISSAFGIFYQKGMIEQMNLGDLRVNYEVEEIFYASQTGYAVLFNQMSDLKIWETVWKMFSNFVVIYFIVFLLIAALYQNKTKVFSWVEKVKQQPSKYSGHLKRSHILYPVTLLSSVLAAGVHALLSVVVVYTMFAIPAVLLLPSAIGFITGSKVVERAIKERPCVKVEDIEPLTDPVLVRQCTHLTIKNRTLKGKIMLQNQDGYFMRLNNGFIYISKNGETCIFSKDKSIPKKDVKKFKFSSDNPEPQIDNFCKKAAVTKPKSKS